MPLVAKYRYTHNGNSTVYRLLNAKEATVRYEQLHIRVGCGREQLLDVNVQQIDF